MMRGGGRFVVGAVPEQLDLKARVLKAADAVRRAGGF